jgi:glycosyltransferase involved in cell wall biosynthesis
MNNHKIVSVIVPCYNNQNTVCETIESIKNQTHKFVQIIVINDGSTDSSLDLIQNYKQKNPTLNMVIDSQKNQGPSSARNNGVKKAIGDYLVFLDADDLISTEYLEKCLLIFENDKKVNLVYSNASFFGTKTGEWKLPNFKISDFLIINCIPIFAMVSHKNFIEIGGFDVNLTFVEDHELWIRILEKFGEKVYKIPENLFFYRKDIEKKSLTDNHKKDNLSEKSMLYIYNKHYDYYKRNGLDIVNLMRNNKYKLKYYSVWYKKLFYFFRKKKINF